MATTFSGPIESENGYFTNNPETELFEGNFQTMRFNLGGALIESGLATDLADATSTYNTGGLVKVAGRIYVDQTTGLWYTATGSSATAVWRASDGTTAITPS